MSTPGSPLQSKLLDRFPALKKIHLLHPQIPLPSLLISFGVLHEITALVPVVGLFYAFRSFGGGPAVVSSLRDLEHDVRSRLGESTSGEEYIGTVDEWIEQGRTKVVKVGERYGILGFEKRDRTTPVAQSILDSRDPKSSTPGGLDGVAGDMVNGVAAYAVVKALAPVRIAASFYLSPSFARIFILPLGKVWRRFRK
ncbi:Uncharacterised protein family FLILHELTA [Phaffia rhodozyma]|uniref:Uncharacterized protein family FLILHELTA n=1 Tax=Phaffia rhodozyma TaxID=264483 RepID=A0A0F7SPI8_PHARH|nr:Uncharacterised protein family FLILHELTA [Phaffia rhodozyma]